MRRVRKPFSGHSGPLRTSSCQSCQAPRVPRPGPAHLAGQTPLGTNVDPLPADHPPPGRSGLSSPAPWTLSRPLLCKLTPPTNCRNLLILLDLRRVDRVDVMLVMRLWPSLAGPWPRCRRSPPVAKHPAVMASGLARPWAGLVLACPRLRPGSGPGPALPGRAALPPVRCHLDGNDAGARVRGWVWPDLARGLGEVASRSRVGPGCPRCWPGGAAGRGLDEFAGVSGRSPPGGVVRLVALVDVWTSWPWWWISGTPPPSSRLSRSRRCPAAPGGVHSPAAGVRAQSPALPGTRPGPAVRRRARPCRRRRSLAGGPPRGPGGRATRSASRRECPSPHPVRSGAPRNPHADRSRSPCVRPSVGLHGWMYVWYIY